MSTLLEQAAEPQVEETAWRSFHVLMACAGLILLILSFVGCKLTCIRLADIGGPAIALLAALAMVTPLPIYWHDKRRTNLRDSTLTIPWALLFAITLPFPVLIAARLHMPLRDSLFVGIDHSLGVSVPAIMAWATRHWVGGMINKSYALLLPLLPVSFLVPALAGKAKHAREFLLANLVAFAIGVPLFALFPAIGPWQGYHLHGTSGQMYCEAQLLALRLPGAHAPQAAGIVCFPSFHVIWAILCAAALWGFRPLRIPVAILSGMIIASTMTTGWHYFTDVLAGAGLAMLSLALAKAYTRFEPPAMNLTHRRWEGLAAGQSSSLEGKSDDNAA